MTIAITGRDILHVLGVLLVLGGGLMIWASGNRTRRQAELAELFSDDHGPRLAPQENLDPWFSNPKLVIGVVLIFFGLISIFG